MQRRHSHIPRYRDILEWIDTTKQDAERMISLFVVAVCTTSSESLKHRRQQDSPLPQKETYFVTKLYMSALYSPFASWETHVCSTKLCRGSCCLSRFANWMEPTVCLARQTVRGISWLLLLQAAAAGGAPLLLCRPSNQAFWP